MIRAITVNFILWFIFTFTLWPRDADNSLGLQEVQLLHNNLSVLLLLHPAAAAAAAITS